MKENNTFWEASNAGISKNGSNTSKDLYVRLIVKSFFDFNLSNKMTFQFHPPLSFHDILTPKHLLIELLNSKLSNLKPTSLFTVQMGECIL